MSPSKLRAWLQDHGEPIPIREIAAVYQKLTGTFAEKRIQRSMKALEEAGLVEFDEGEHGAKLWHLTKDGVEAEEPTGIDPDYAASAE